MKFIPHDYQKVAKDFILDRQAAGLFLDMGLGKTVTTLTAIEELKNDYLEDIKVLVIAPKRVAEDTWTTEYEKWDHLKDLKVIKVLGTPKERKLALQQEGDIYIITRDNIAWLVELLGRKWDFNTIVIDELSSFKSNTSKRFKKLRIVRPLIKRVIGLTGTPAPNGYMDLWSQVYLLDRGERLGKTITEYRKRYFNTLYRPGYNDYELREGAKEEIDEALKDLCISMKAKDYLKLKEPLYINRIAKLDKKEFETYKKMERDAVLEFENEDITALNAAAVSNKLLQLANGAVYTDEREVIEIHNKKLEVLEELIEEANGEPVLVLYNFQHDRDRILKKFKKDVRILEDEKDIKDWNNRKIKIFLAHPAGAGHGLNLQAGGSIIIWFGLNWSLELYQQANARLARQGQKETVRIYHIIAEGTRDGDVLEVLKGKNLRQEELLRKLKAEIKRS
ncbi:MAG TPA: DEAD/DEAH box helicase [Tissierella sp.]|uniref:DEAD/DEAH box helicase n=1 Tax=Tissierella praeacuta TaxID=43131 RepID=UPI000EC23FD2|nr:DEAD/DEAH box helicase [Tissierella praeacuta]HAE92702.1 DEAD/DEAH box helicase [Tissierella sp.]